MIYSRLEKILFYFVPVSLVIFAIYWTIHYPDLKLRLKHLIIIFLSNKTFS